VVAAQQAAQPVLRLHHMMEQEGSRFGSAEQLLDHRSIIKAGIDEQNPDRRPVV
jgi:hypothetical protein